MAHEEIPPDSQHPAICDKINECLKALNKIEGKVMEGIPPWEPPCGKKHVCYCLECTENPDI